MVKATRLEILEFIKDKETISVFDLVNQFNYTHGGAGRRLNYLKELRLVVNERRGEWTLTDDGMRRLIYYGRCP